MTDFIYILIYRYIPEGLGTACGPDWYTKSDEFNSESYTYFLLVTCFMMPITIIKIGRAHV